MTIAARFGSLNGIWRAILVLCIGAAGGALFRLLHLPLPWTLGAMFGSACLTFFLPRATLPGVFRDGARPVIGVMAGSAFTPAVTAAMAGQWPALLLLLVFFIVTTSLGFLFFRSRGIDPKTALFSSMPGGLGEMTLLGSQFGADVRALVLIHSVRIVMVVTVVPFAISLLVGEIVGRGAPVALSTSSLWGPQGALLLACAVIGYLIGRPLRGFGGVMIAPLLLSAVLHATGVLEVSPPYFLVAAMQVVIGCITGARFVGVRIGEVKCVLGMALVWSAMLIGMAMLVARGVAHLMGLPPMALFLALAPGGFAEMSVIAVATGVETGFVIACHTFRVLYVLMVSPTLCRLLLR